ncbi:hypothetical protein EZV62_025567 [Acer yangbiense]|uniref:DUF674 domain-containing protein n=1 Tax=Acer yangbiense TaxID=1000413 RepID=A0A5C7GZD0_9ROSI|nr:hypothetical protein EZV62_025567 [Acer yangbiense]
MGDTKVKLKLLIDTKCQTVVFAEAGKDFFESIFKTLSDFGISTVGNVVLHLQETGEEEDCFNNFLKSIEKLSETEMQPDESKSNSLSLQYPSGQTTCSIEFPILLSDLMTRKVYICESFSCFNLYVADQSMSLCPRCQRNIVNKMCNVSISSSKTNLRDEAGFGNGLATYMVMDDLEVKPMSTKSFIDLLDKFNIKDASVLQERVVDLSREKCLLLLKASLSCKSIEKLGETEMPPDESKSISLQYPSAQTTCTIEFPILLSDLMKQKICFCLIGEALRLLTLAGTIAKGAMEAPKLQLKLFFDTKANTLLFAEADKDFVDFLLYFLSLPVSTVVRLLDKRTEMGCLDDLYNTIEKLSDFYGCMQKNRIKDCLLNPRGPIPSSEIPLLLSDLKTLKVYACKHNCYVAYVPDLVCPDCKGNFKNVIAEIVSHVSIYKKYDDRAGLVVSSATYMVMDNLEVNPMITTSGVVTLLKKFGVKEVDDLEERVVEFGLNELHVLHFGLKLMKVSMECKTVLSSVFLVGKGAAS